MEQHPLVGKTVESVFISDDKYALKFVLADGTEIIARVGADCCSETWIESLENPENLLGTIRSVEEKDLKDAWQDGDFIQFYGCEITSEKGYCLIDYRNSSNGYYGGSLVWPGSHFYGGVYRQVVSTNYNWKVVASIN